jgi:tellurite methyltransferase
MNKLFLIFLFITFDVLARAPIAPTRFEQLSGTKKVKDSKEAWDHRYASQSFIYGKSPAKFLAENYDYIPFGATVLDMGMGEGRNAVFLAQKGYMVTGVDLSSIAVKKANMLAKEMGVKIKTVVASLKKYPIANESFDAILCFYWVDRSMIADMLRWLKPGGVIIYEGFTTEQEKQKGFNKVDHTFLKPQELLNLFGQDVTILKFEENNHSKEFKSSIIVQKKAQK